MLRYIILVFFLNTRFTSLGKSIEATSLNIENSLNILANTCENSFLKEQIGKKASECPANLQPHKEDHLRCLLFYDMSKQLCEAVGANKLELHKEQLENLNKTMTVESVCNSSSKWNITNLVDYPHYKPRIDKILGSIASCALLCSEDLESLIAKYSCKYYSWGLSILSTNSQQPVLEIKNNATMPSSVTFNKIDALKKVISSPEISSIKNIQNIDQEQTVYSKPVELNKQIKQEKTTLQVTIAPTNKPDAHLIPTRKEQQQTGIEKSEIQLDDSAVERPNVEEKPLHKTHLIKDSDTNLNIAKEIGDDPKAKPAEGDEYQNGEFESDDIKDGLGDTQGDDDGEGDPMPDIDTKMTVNHDKVIKNLETSIAALQEDVISNREYVSNTFPDSFNTGDDHFFPIFLTSIVMLVLLYVLYHNKTKVSKVVLGLIVEGRQSGRRRNSRGHAYRRLDTLEQAMSTNSSAPPSKIIY